MKNRRWYDKDPVLKLAVDLIEKSSDSVKDYVADYIIEEAKNLGLELSENNFDCFWQRWQDNNMKYFEAMEYLKIIDYETKKSISMEIIRYIRNFKTDEQ